MAYGSVLCALAAVAVSCALLVAEPHMLPDPRTSVFGVVVQAFRANEELLGTFCSILVVRCLPFSPSTILCSRCANWLHPALAPFQKYVDKHVFRNPSCVHPLYVFMVVGGSAVTLHDGRVFDKVLTCSKCSCDEVGAFAGLVFLMSLVISCILVFALRISDAGSLKGVAGNNGTSVVVAAPWVKYERNDRLYTERTTCKPCEGVITPPRSYFCKVCKEYRPRFDHHCALINNCIGQGNHALFLVFLCAHLTLVSSAFALLFTECRAKNISFVALVVQHRRMAVAAALLGLVMVILAAFCYYEIERCAQNVTKYEDILLLKLDLSEEDKEKVRKFYNKGGIIANFADIIVPPCKHFFSSPRKEQACKMRWSREIAEKIHSRID